MARHYRISGPRRSVGESRSPFRQELLDIAEEQPMIKVVRIVRTRRSSKNARLFVTRREIHESDSRHCCSRFALSTSGGHTLREVT
jgi:hypothetical protein